MYQLIHMQLSGQSRWPYCTQGRAPVSFFACDEGFAVGDGSHAAQQEFAQLVAGLHGAGFEVFVQVCPRL